MNYISIIHKFTHFLEFKVEDSSHEGRYLSDEGPETPGLSAVYDDESPHRYGGKHGAPRCAQSLSN
jgi:hypothetical protein